MIRLDDLSAQDSGVFSCQARTGRAASGILDTELTVMNATQILTQPQRLEVITNTRSVSSLSSVQMIIIRDTKRYLKVMSGARLVLDCEHLVDENIAATAGARWSKDSEDLAFRF